MQRLALSEDTGVLEFYVVDTKLAGINSLCKIDGATTEIVSVQRLDEFVKDKNIGHILFAKCDTEGNDFSVLSGAVETLQQGKVDIF